MCRPEPAVIPNGSEAELGLQRDFTRSVEHADEFSGRPQRTPRGGDQIVGIGEIPPDERDTEPLVLRTEVYGRVQAPEARLNPAGCIVGGGLVFGSVGA